MNRDIVAALYVCVPALLLIAAPALLRFYDAIRSVFASFDDAESNPVLPTLPCAVYVLSARVELAMLTLQRRVAMSSYARLAVTLLLIRM